MSSQDFRRGRPPGVRQSFGVCDQAQISDTQSFVTPAIVSLGPIIPATPPQGATQDQGGYDWSRYDSKDEATWKRVYDNGKWVGYERPSSNLGPTTYGPWIPYTGSQQPRTELTPAENAQVKAMTDTQFLSSPLYFRHYWRILERRYVYAGDRVIGHQDKRSQN